MIRPAVIALLLLFGMVATVSAQDLDVSDYDFSQIEVDDLTDAQIRAIYNRAQEQGLSVSELEKLALARGMRPSEIVKFRQRIYDIRYATSADESDGEGRRQARGARGEERFDEDDPFAVLLDQRYLYRIHPDSTDSTRVDSTRKKIFGEDLFRSESLTFEPSLNIPTPADYQLAAGDELIINVWGAAEMTYRVPVTREGTIRIENLGPVHVNGLSMEEAERRIVGQLGRLYAGLGSQQPTEQNVYADISLGKVRSIKVHILGEVKYPGSYTLPALSTVFNALYVCSGPNENGTYRRIQVIRQGNIISELDVYDFLIYGRETGNVRLRDQDVVKVDPYIAHVEIEGEIKRPAIYELKGGETLGDLVRYAGLFNGKAYTRSIKMYRNTPTERRIVTVDQRDYDAFDLHGGDHVFVDPILERFSNRVEIQGAVFRPGDYEMDDAKTVYGLIQRAEGLKGDAYLPRGQIYRTKDDLSTALISFDVGKLIQNPEQHDVPLRREDVVVIPSLFDMREQYTVAIDGAVQQPDEYPYMEDMTLKDLIVMSGGLREEASLVRVEVSRRRTHGTSLESISQIADIQYFEIDKDLSLSEQDEKFMLQPFDQVFVRQEPGYIEQKNVKLTGEVKYPGTYTIENKGTRISQILERAGGLTPESYPSGARLFRKQGNIGAVGIRLDRITAQPGSEFDLLVEDGDSLHVPPELETVAVKGSVYYPVSIRFARGLDLEDYINNAGGPTDNGDVSKAYVVYPNGSVDRVRRSVLFRHTPDIEPGAIIVVPPKPQEEKMSPQERALIISSIVTVASVVSTAIYQLTR